MNELIREFMHENKWLDYENSYDAIMPVLEKINSPMKVKIYGGYREISGENVDIIIHNSWQTQRYITLKIEYGRRFKEFTEYKRDDEKMIKPIYRLIVNFIKWFNNHQ